MLPWLGRCVDARRGIASRASAQAEPRPSPANKCSDLRRRIDEDGRARPSQRAARCGGGLAMASATAGDAPEGGAGATLEDALRSAAAPLLAACEWRAQLALRGVSRASRAALAGGGCRGDAGGADEGPLWPALCASFARDHALHCPEAHASSWKRCVSSAAEQRERAAPSAPPPRRAPLRPPPRFGALR